MTTEKISVKYLGCDLVYSEDGNRWSTHIDPENSSTWLSALSLKELKDRVAKAIGPTAGKRVSVILSNYSGDRLVTVNPLMDGQSVWITNASGTRSKERLDNLLADTPENRKLMEQRKKLRLDMQALQKTHDELGGQMTPYVPITKAQ